MSAVPADLHALGWVDGLVVLCLAVPTIRGWQTGIVPGLLRLGGIVGGAWIGWAFTPELKGIALRLVPGLVPSTVPWFCALGCALLGWGAGGFAGWLWNRSTRDNPVGWIDRGSGAALGLAKGAALVVVLLAAVQAAIPSARADIRSSQTGRLEVLPFIESVASWGLRAVRERRVIP
jgi:uncharacterized membrane protein required for colicin V production